MWWRRRAASSRQFQQIGFLGEQDGPPEQDLKVALIRDVLTGPVRRAYLARMDADGQRSVALCFRGGDERATAVVEQAGRVFASLFGQHEHLDMLFLTEAQESELRRVCPPFFVAGEV